MWSFGCILAELTTGKPLFPALDENELLELFIMIIGLPTQQMIEKAKKRSKFFDKNMKLIRSKNSRLQKVLKKKSFPLKDAVQTDGDNDFLDFLEVIYFFKLTFRNVYAWIQIREWLQKMLWNIHGLSTMSTSSCSVRMMTLFKQLWIATTSQAKAKDFRGWLVRIFCRVSFWE